MKRLIIGSVAAVFALAVMAAFAEEKAAAPAVAAPAVEKAAPAAAAPAIEKPAKPAKAAEALQEITVIGKVSKEEKTTTNKKGVEVKSATFILTDAEGMKIALPVARATRKAPAAYSLESFVDKTVKVVGKGTVAEKNGKKHVTLNKIESIAEEAVAAPAAAAPAAKPAEAVKK
jgi:hypothetical protein